MKEVGNENLQRDFRDNIRMKAVLRTFFVFTTKQMRSNGMTMSQNNGKGQLLLRKLNFMNCQINTD